MRAQVSSWPLPIDGGFQVAGAGCGAGERAGQGEERGGFLVVAAVLAEGGAEPGGAVAVVDHDEVAAGRAGVAGGRERAG